MNKYRVSIAVSILSIIILFFIAFVNTGYLQILQKNDKTQSGELCNFITDGLRFCIDRQKTVVVLRGLVILNFSFTNISNQEVEVSKYDGGNYIFKVTDEKGNLVLTKLEQKMKRGLMTYDDQRELVHSMIRNHRSISIQPNEVYNEKIYLSNIYNFANIGKYHVEVTRRTMNPNGEGFIETSLGKIEIEVKDENN